MKSLARLPALLLLLFAGAASAQLAGGAQSADVFTGKDAQGIVESAIARETGISGIAVSINSVRDQDIIAQGAGAIGGSADGVTVDKARSRWEATLLLQENGRNLAPIRLSGRYDEVASVPVLKRRVMPGEVISQDDIDWDRQPASHLRRNTVTDPKDMVGKSPRHMLSQGRPIRLDEIASPSIMSKGAKVTMTFRSHNIEINTYGEAMEAGAKGDVIRVRNLASKAVVEGTVESSDAVRVSAPESNAAEVMP